MNLTLEQLKTITVGALKVWEEDNGYHFAKCTEKQVKAWYEQETILGERAETTTGVRLDFYTNSTLFSFTASLKGKYEIYIDNVLTYAYEEEEADETTKTISLDGAEHRITLILPSHTVGVLQKVELSDGATIAPHKFDCKMMFFGDSITQGWNTKWDSLSYAYRVSRFFNAESIIQGIGGSYYHSSTFDEAIDFVPDIVCVAYGTNDWGHYSSMEELQEQCSSYLDQLTAKFAGAKIFGISPIWRADTEEPRNMGTFEECCALVQNEIKKHNMILIDGQTLTPHLPDFFDDGFLHPDSNGFGVYAESLIKEMQKYL